MMSGNRPLVGAVFYSREGGNLFYKDGNLFRVKQESRNSSKIISRTLSLNSTLSSSLFPSVDTNGNIFARIFPGLPLKKV
jgi:hypothetical protein